MPSVTLFIYKYKIFMLFQYKFIEYLLCPTLCRILCQILVPRGNKTKSQSEISQSVLPTPSLRCHLSWSIVRHKEQNSHSNLLYVKENIGNLTEQQYQRNIKGLRVTGIKKDLKSYSPSFCPHLPFSLHQTYPQVASFHSVFTWSIMAFTKCSSQPPNTSMVDFQEQHHCLFPSLSIFNLKCPARESNRSTMQ